MLNFVRLRSAEEEADRLYRSLADADQNVEELEEEVEALAESRANMRVEIHEAHCQVRASHCLCPTNSKECINCRF